MVLWQKLIWFYEFLSHRNMIIAVAQLVSCSMHKFMFVTTFEMIFFFESEIEHQKCDEHSF